MPQLIPIVANEVVLYRRNRSARWQARLKLADKTWRRVSTKEQDSVLAGKVAMKLYYAAEFKRENKLPQNTRRFDAVAKAVVAKLHSELEAGTGKVVYRDYITSIGRYLVPFFGKHNIDSITPTLMQKFDTWRTQKLGRVPLASTITNHNSALNKVFDYALGHGWVTQTVLPLLKNKGKKGTSRPAFTLREYLLRKRRPQDDAVCADATTVCGLRAVKKHTFQYARNGIRTREHADAVVLDEVLKLFAQ